MQFGDRINLKVTPGLVLLLSREAEDFVQGLVNRSGEVDLERECLLFGQSLLKKLGEEARRQEAMEMADKLAEKTLHDTTKEDDNMKPA